MLSLRFSVDTAATYAEIRQQLKNRATPIPSNDIWIAALARQHNLSILSTDTHFDNIAGIHGNQPSAIAGIIINHFAKGEYNNLGGDWVMPSDLGYPESVDKDSRESPKSPAAPRQTTLTTRDDSRHAATLRYQSTARAALLIDRRERPQTPA